MYKVLGYYTVDTDYEEMAERMAESARKFGLEVELIPIQSLGEWVLNCGQKSLVIQNALLNNTCDILYVDADAEFKDYPIFFDGFAGHLSYHLRSEVELLGGTMYFRNTTVVKRLVKRWVKAQEKTPHEWDQKVLQKVIKESKDLELDIVPLPKAYVKIFSEMKDVKHPIIEHYQASRKMKAKIVSEPIRVANQWTQPLSDGSFRLAKSNASAEKILDERYARVKGELRWFPTSISDIPDAKMESIFKGQTVGLVGKGSSLDLFKPEDFEVGPIIAINEAIHYIETLKLPNQTLCIQQDTRLKTSCLPKESILLISNGACAHYHSLKNKYIYNPLEYKLNTNALSVECAIAIAKRFGAIGFRLYAFDSFSGNFGYAECIGYLSTEYGRAERFQNHPRRIRTTASPLPITLAVPSHTTSDSTPLLPYNQTEHHASDHTQHEAACTAMSNSASRKEQILHVQLHDRLGIGQKS